MTSSTLLIALLVFAVLLIAYLLVRLLRSERDTRRRGDRMRHELTQGLDVFERELTAQLTTHTVPQRLMEHLRTTLASQSEQLLPLSAAFPYDPADARFLGSPIDYVVFSGRASGTVEEVVFVEVKQHARLQLTTPEKSLKEAIEAGRVRWERLDLAEGAGVNRDAVRDAAGEELEADVSRTVREKTSEARRQLLERLTKHF